MISSGLTPIVNLFQLTLATLTIPIAEIFAIRYITEDRFPNSIKKSVEAVSLEPTKSLAVFSIKRDSKFNAAIFVCTEPDTCQLIHNSLNDKIFPAGLWRYLNLMLETRRRRVYAVLNPFSGTKKAQSRWDQIYQPMLELAGIQATLQGIFLMLLIIVTTHAKHATQLAQELSLTEFDVAVTIGGDGIFHEFMALISC